MNTSKSKRVLSKLTNMVAISALIMGVSVVSHAEPTGYNQISFSADASQQVENDELLASMYKKAQATEPNVLARELTTSMNQAMRIAAKYPSVQVTTGSQYTHPRYDDNDKIIGWTGQASVNIKSTDIEAASQLIAELQETLVMESLNFGISDAKREVIEQQLITEASKAFQAQAQNVAQAWGSNSYRVLSINLHSNGYYPQPMMRSSLGVAEASAPMNYESGNSTLTITADGSIELVK